ncbi:MAG TPA: hypothetical protein VKU02_05110 [Gemmataceae bacterium]|nr:hypothetical protein [Gemmataceae bacterium]
MNRTITQLLSAGVTAGVVVGCQHPCRQPSPPPPPPPVTSPYPIPPPANPSVPPQPIFPQVPAAPAPAPIATRSYEPPFAPPEDRSWRPPTENGVRLAPPDGATSPPAVGGARLQSPQFNIPSSGAAPPGEERAPTPLLPAGIPQFAIAKEQVATGLKPMLDGVDWLKENGYRAVLHVRQPAEDDAAERKLFEMRGLKYLSLELSPQTLSPAVVAEFNRMVAEPGNLPLFVYGKSGPLVGGLWYLHFREVEHLSDAEARTRAGRLGLPESPNGLQQEMWLAIQKYLSEQGR